MSEITELIEMWQRDPQMVENILRANPAIAQKFIEMDDIWRAGEAVSVDGFRKAYEQFYGRPMPYVDEPVAEAFVWAYHERKESSLRRGVALASRRSLLLGVHM